MRQRIPGKTGEWCAADTAGCLTKLVGNRVSLSPLPKRSGGLFRRNRFRQGVSAGARAGVSCSQLATSAGPPETIALEQGPDEVWGTTGRWPNPPLA